MWFSTVVPFTSIFTSLISILISNTLSSQSGNTSRNEIISKYSESERNGLILFRKMVDDVLEKDYERDDQFLIRWIRACNFDLNAAEEMLRKAQKFRKDFNMDGILDETPLDFGPGRGNGIVWNLDGVAYDGTPVFIVKTVKLDIRGLLMRGLKSNLTRQMFQILERMTVRIRHLNEVSGRDVSTGTIVADGSIYNLKQHGCFDCITAFLELLRMTQNIYPEYSGLAVLVNAPHILKPILDIAKPILSASSLKSLHIFGSDKREWRTFLLKHIPSDQLSPHFGGTAPW